MKSSCLSLIVDDEPDVAPRSPRNELGERASRSRQAPRGRAGTRVRPVRSLEGDRTEQPFHARSAPWLRHDPRPRRVRACDEDATTDRLPVGSVRREMARLAVPAAAQERQRRLRWSRSYARARQISLSSGWYLRVGASSTSMRSAMLREHLGGLAVGLDGDDRPADVAALAHRRDERHLAEERHARALGETCAAAAPNSS